jgi:hypothetical protein
MTTSKRESAFPEWLPYTAPIIVFALFTFAEGYAPRQFYFYAYLAKVVLVTAVLVFFKSTWRDIQPTARVVPLAVLVGVLVFAQWVVLDKFVPYPHFGERTGFDPYTSFENSTLRTLFLITRFYGLVIMVPLMEELFWRSFLLRYFTDANFKRVPLGVFSWTAFLIVAAVFGISHPEWLVAVITACAYALLLKQTRSLFACIVAHAVTNLALGIYVVATGDWVYW